jgi:uncharacterized protein YqeY
MKERDRTAVRALRSALAAVANAEAPPIDSAPQPGPGTGTEHPPRVLSPSDLERIVRSEIDDRQDTMAKILPHGRVDEARELQAEIDVLRAYVG